MFSRWWPFKPKQEPKQESKQEAYTCLCLRCNWTVTFMGNKQELMDWWFLEHTLPGPSPPHSSYEIQKVGTNEIDFIPGGLY